MCGMARENEVANPPSDPGAASCARLRLAAFSLLRGGGEAAVKRHRCEVSAAL